MIIDIKVPQLAESIAEATLLAWQKQAGEAVSRGDNLIDIETDKVTLEVTAPDDGVLKEIVKEEGASVGSDEVIARLDTGATADSAAAASSEPERTAEAASADDRASATETDSEAADDGSARKQSPAVRRLLEEHQLDADSIPPSRADGRLTKQDVLSYIELRDKEAAEPEQPQPTAADGTEQTAKAPPAQPAGERPEERVPMTRLRKRVAERLLSAQHDHALLTTFNEINMAPLQTLRERYKKTFEDSHGVKLGFMSFFTKAAVEALKRFPVINASIDGEDIVYHGYFDIGIAVSSERGLVVPIVRDADQLSFADIESTIRDYGERAQSGKLKLEELTGGTFTITNGGVFGSLMSTPIINPPQSAILGMHAIQDRPVAENGEIVIRPMMYVAVSYDHRIVDGREAVQFLVTIKEMIEDPARLLLEV
ncbi:2-oxoglutarate dehydrogenase E2 component (dihydrolipoamide succinyltransferase) [Methylohalomonas lacus]|uniref:Dihydrolipoyllysine-residue succinyltransferase component of 2-oxoglutarate dehydrogenase complex n=1 Tax=Methylohalomonas lacus TaxID=398773 RepID=A0AAE3HKS7_9GAMM|nr:2-oxoglutarate dehydrogenase complex dihydrolipoyllysine-residue succinyltransferase [Methylohalomonas lacus]MCS3903048.1 2-oxoglutarate dehydrogenase E2 component (dihydrolipoamide succinyltransferase) [Methylohalomonas lacus]